MTASQVALKKLNWPKFGKAEPVIFPSVDELETRLNNCRERMKKAALTHLVVYGDREHFANLLYLVHFDPRFEEALLILPLTGTPLLLVGNECVSHLTVSPLYQAGALRYERYQSFSLLSQPRSSSRSLETICRSEGMDSNSRIGCVGWKYFETGEFPEARTAIDLPGFIVDTLRAVSSKQQVTNETAILMSPADGLKSFLTPFEIAHFEFSNVMASEGMVNFFKNFKTGVTDFELVSAYQYTGYPLGCHVGLKSEANLHIGLSSPAGGKIRLGDPCSTNLSYWGSNICRAGWAARDAQDLPEAARNYVQEFAAPYFYACVQWLQHLRIGAKGKTIYKLVQDLLPFDEFAVFLNPGHLIHYEEWTSSPVYEGSEDEIKSGMYFQLDIIPRSKTFFSSRMEDGYVVADEGLRMALKKSYPATYERCIARRRFMEDELGITLPPEVLPLSNTCGLVPPFFLDYETVLTLKP